MMNVFKTALETWGEDAQIKVAIEEMSELTFALCKHWRGKDNLDNIQEEIADVMLMMDQMAYLFGRSKVYDYYEEKFKKLTNKLEKNGV